MSKDRAGGIIRVNEPHKDWLAWVGLVLATVGVMTLLNFLRLGVLAGYAAVKADIVATSLKESRDKFDVGHWKVTCHKIKQWPGHFYHTRSWEFGEEPENGDWDDTECRK